MKIYTKTGDKGSTDLIGTRVSKDDLRIECYGTLDEANSYIGLLISNLETAYEVKGDLYKIQRKIFDVNTQLASIKEVHRIHSEDIVMLEGLIDYYQSKSPVLDSFILPGGSISASTAHVIRTVIRRAERRLVTLSETVELDPLLIKYVNRLSDYFFALARYLNVRNNLTDIKK